MSTYNFKSQTKAQAFVRTLIKNGADPSEIKTSTRNGQYIVEHPVKYGIFGS